jgi:hypothetical protein
LRKMRTADEWGRRQMHGGHRGGHTGSSGASRLNENASATPWMDEGTQTPEARKTRGGDRARLALSARSREFSERTSRFGCRNQRFLRIVVSASQSPPRCGLPRPPLAQTTGSASMGTGPRGGKRVREARTPPTRSASPRAPPPPLLPNGTLATPRSVLHLSPKGTPRLPPRRLAPLTPRTSTASPPWR